MAALPLSTGGAPQRPPRRSRTATDPRRSSRTTVGRAGSAAATATAKKPGPANARRHSHTTELRLVPRRRRAAGIAVFCAIVLASLMLGAAVLHTRLAQRQLQIDRIEDRVAAEHAQFEVLRGERAELRSPGRLAEEAEALGMRPATTGEYVPIDPWDLARVIASVGDTPASKTSTFDEEPLDQFRAVKDVGRTGP